MIIEILNLCVALANYQDELERYNLSTKAVQRRGMDANDTRMVKAVEAALDNVPITCFVLLELLDLTDSAASLVRQSSDGCLPFTLTSLSTATCGARNFRHTSLSVPSQRDKTGPFKLLCDPSYLREKCQGSAKLLFAFRETPR